MNPDRDPFDPTLDALLRADSGEAPSPDIDAAILAAAHRAIQSAPRDAKAAEATSPWRWWMPLAAAATIGAITIGVLQLAPQHPDSSTATIVSDTPPPAVRAAPETAAPAPTPPPAVPMTKDRSEAPRTQSEAPPRAKVHVDRLTPAPAARNEADRAAAPEPFPAQRRDTPARESAAEQSSAAGALATPQAPQAAAPATAKQRAADAQAMSPEQWIARI